MTREELVKQKAHSLGQKYFPDENNVWARANFEAQWVSEACMEMAKWEHKRLVDMACEWLEELADGFIVRSKILGYDCDKSFLVEDFKQRMGKEL